MRSYLYDLYKIELSRTRAAQREYKIADDERRYPANFLTTDHADAGETKVSRIPD